VADLDAWLLEQIAEDERLALAASPGPWKPNAERDEVLAVDDITVCDGFALGNRQLRATVDHIAEFDPFRVLAECNAKRQIIERYQFVTGHGPAVDHTRAMDMTVGAVAALRDILQMLALPYAERPGYLEVWRP
jgi:hypothetical protein